MSTSVAVWGPGAFLLPSVESSASVRGWQLPLLGSNANAPFPFPKFPGAASTDSRATIAGMMPQEYGTSNLDVRIYWFVTTSGTNDVVWRVSWKSLTAGTDQIDKAFASEQTVTTTSVSANVVIVSSRTFTQAQADNVAAGDAFEIRIDRDPDDANDTETNDAFIFAVELRYA